MTARRILLLTIIVLAAGRRSSGETPDLQRDVMPILKARCVRCHGPAKQEARLNLALPVTIARGGEQGTLIADGDAEKSLLWRRVAADEMPPDEPLPAEEKAVLRPWVEAGAPGLPTDFPAIPAGDEHWAFQPLSATQPPEAGDLPPGRTALDRFVQARLSPLGLTIGAEADRATLIRRVAFDLTGLPPTIDELRVFLNDAGEGAYERMVERYLDSPHYGERWGKYWLDAAGYADSNGYFNADTDRPWAYHYRDWVIAAINADMPFDAFLRAQLAGDELVGYREGADVTRDMLAQLPATHFLRNSPDGTDSSDGNDDERRADKYAVLEGTVQIIGSSLFGLTMQCARCHDHKFEPFSQRDYYSLQAVLYPAFHVEEWKFPRDRHIALATTGELRAAEAKTSEIDERIAAQRRRFDAWVKEHRPATEALLEQDFNGDGAMLSAVWSNAAPGDAEPAGAPPIRLDAADAPAAQIQEGRLRIIESGDAGDRALATKATFDWTPDEVGAWIQVTFDLVETPDDTPYVAYLIALRDFNDRDRAPGGNVLIDGARDGGAAVHLDYPGADSRDAGKIGKYGYEAKNNYGVRVTNRGEGRFEVSHVVYGVPEEATLTLSAEDLPDGAFGFEYCGGRSFVVDNLVIEQRAGGPERAALEVAFATELQQRRAQVKALVKEWNAERPSPPAQLAFVTDLTSTPPPVPLLERGDYKSPRDPAPAAAPSVLSEASNPSGLAVAPKPERGTTGQRLAFAEWLTKPDSRAASLLARVTVNRWWAHHFGAGIVATTDNLGYSGAPPTHPDLLEYLAGELVRGGWSAKAIHRLILHSATYRQSSAPTPESARQDPEARLLSRFPLRRLDAEAIRDAMLAVAGELDEARGGAYVPTRFGDDGDVVVEPDTPGALRRSVYLQQRRTQVLGMLSVFDAPSLVTNCTFRMQTTVPLQSLKLLNSEFVRERSTALAQRVLKSDAATTDERLSVAFELACSRRPTAPEFEAARTFILAQPSEYAGSDRAEELAWTDFCQALLASSAFLYVE